MKKVRNFKIINFFKTLSLLFSSHLLFFFLLSFNFPRSPQHIFEAKERKRKKKIIIWIFKN